jgi:predicted DNA-binding WGR domain protein
MTRNFICIKANADKFWTIKAAGKSITTIYGKNNKKTNYSINYIQ